jgi:hypothetical protein
LAFSGPQIVGAQLTLWGALESFEGNERLLPGFVFRQIRRGLIQNSAKQGSDYRVEHRNTSYYQSLARFEIRVWAGLQAYNFRLPLRGG